MVDADNLRIRTDRPDPAFANRRLQQLSQYHLGIPVWGAGVSRQIDGGATVAVYGEIYTDPAISVVPTISDSDARAIIEGLAGVELGSGRLPVLHILPTDGLFRLVWVGDIFTVENGLVRYFIDADSGDVVRQMSVEQTQLPSGSYVGRGRGVLGDDKKLSTDAVSGGFVAYDTIRPPAIATFDFRANFSRFQNVMNGVVPLATSDLASTGSSNQWLDGGIVDAHAYASYAYDYYYKRHDRRGLDDKDLPLVNMTHVVRRSDAQFARSLIGRYWAQASYYGDGLMYYGEGLDSPENLVGVGLQRWNHLAGALDVVGHELTHGITDYSSQLIYENQSGALNESFSDIMGTSIEFMFQPSKADYLIGEDVVTPASPSALAGLRSMENPRLYGQPDHMNSPLRQPFTSRPSDLNDYGGVHTNSGISNQAFYLAVEGGTNRTSGIRVQGVGAANRVQIEKVFYRAFTQLMPPNATFALARTLTLQAAADLYGSNSQPYAAVRDAWTAVGVN